MTPVLPSEFESCLTEPGDKLWQIIRKTCLKFPVLWWKWHRYAYKSDGVTFTDEYKNDLCAAMKKHCEDRKKPETTTT